MRTPEDGMLGVRPGTVNALLPRKGSTAAPYISHRWLVYSEKVGGGLGLGLILDLDLDLGYRPPLAGLLRIWSTHARLALHPISDLDLDLDLLVDLDLDL